MSKPNRSQYIFSQRKIRDRCFVLVIIGMVLILPPVADIAKIDQRILGIPFTILYLFLTWAGLIFCAFLLSRPLKNMDLPPDDDAINQEHES